MEDRTPVLLSKPQADLKEFASKDTSKPNLTYIRVTKDFAEATDGHIIVRVPHDGISPEEWPATPGTGAGLNGDSVLLEPKILDKAFKNTDNKSHLPILGYVHLSLDEKENPILTATDLGTTVNFRQRKADGFYPNTDQLIPGGREVTFALGAGILSRLADWAEKHGKLVEFYVGEKWSDSVLIKIPRKDHCPPATCVIAACRPANLPSAPVKTGEEPCREEEEHLKAALMGHC